MLNQESLVDIHVLHRQGCSIRGISRQLGISRNTVRSYLRELVILPEYGPRAARPSKLDTFKPYLRERIEAAKPYWIPAIVLFRELQTQGYEGQEGLVKIYIRQFKPITQEPVVRFETAPGQQMQVDFTTIKRGRNKLKGFVATLEYSRACYVCFSEYEKQEDWLAGIEGALNYFGGVPKEILFDNAKCIMIERDAYGEGRHRWNSKLLQLSTDYGFRLRACRPYRAKTKGKVERFNGYLKHSFITPLAATMKQAGLTLDIDTANGQIGPWLHDVAHQRIHGTTKQQPEVLLIKEKLALSTLPAKPTLATPMAPISRHALPIESFQHPLSTYDQLLEVAL
ncbi:IS21 family transposase [uncultured Paraglaciecola sp.]|uniref:IS21 family transposase n=1 Tax=uncultured Paraglaciecola sp. TaxID=1765024 RepID=UPI0030D8402F|tara:strand:- start:1733 stop:2752 length:1020 start_codon:yes stop_codon:yes gene_type:complete